jgi:hypothetical protein
VESKYSPYVELWSKSRKKLLCAVEPQLGPAVKNCVVKWSDQLARSRHANACVPENLIKLNVANSLACSPINYGALQHIREIALI